MENFHKRHLWALILFTLALENALAAKSEFSYPCVGTSPCVKKFMSQVWKQDSDFFLLKITDEDFRSNCSQAQTCLNDATGGGEAAEISDVTKAAVSFVYDVCSENRQQQFGSTLRQCILSDGIRTKAENFHKKWISDRDANLAAIAVQNQVSKFCALLKTYLMDIQSTLTGGGCTNAVALNWCMKIVRENAYEKYGAFCPCYGNCDCNYIKSSPLNRGNGAGAGYMMLVFGIFFLIGAVLVRKNGRKR